MSVTRHYMPRPSGRRQAALNAKSALSLCLLSLWAHKEKVSRPTGRNKIYPLVARVRSKNKAAIIKVAKFLSRLKSFLGRIYSRELRNNYLKSMASSVAPKRGARYSALHARRHVALNAKSALSLPTYFFAQTISRSPNRAK